MYVMKRKPHLHDGAIGPDKNRLVEIPPGSGKPTDDRSTDSVST